VSRILDAAFFGIGLFLILCPTIWLLHDGWVKLRRRHQVLGAVSSWFTALGMAFGGVLMMANALP
jgi:hypothetical protein